MKTIGIFNSHTRTDKTSDFAAIWERNARHCVSTVRLPLRFGIALFTFLLVAVFLFIGHFLQRIDPGAGILDIGVLSVLLLGMIGGFVCVLCSLWLQELLWQPFKVFRKQFRLHFNQLTPWQQCILYFSVFFLLLYAVLWALALVL